MKSRDRLLLLLGGLLLGLVLSSLMRPAKEPDVATDIAGNSGSWTCSMHPQILRPDPGKCPICAMDLIPVGSAGSAGPRQFSMSPEARALARIETSVVERRSVTAEVRLVGKVDYDETRIRTISARFPARIDRLYVDFTGIEVHQNDHLARVYSEELLTAQRELLVARGDSARLSTIRDKLRLLGLPEDGIRAIEQTGNTFDQMDIDAPSGGIVLERLVSEGAYVKKGDPLFRIADLSEVWVNFDAYESDLAWLRYGQSVSFEAEALPGRAFEGTVAFLSPSLDATTRTVRVRVNAENPDGALKPGMFARARVASHLAANGKVIAPELKDKWISPMHPEIIRDEPGDCPICGMKLVQASDLGYTEAASSQSASTPLVVPTSAVLLTGRRAVVYVETPATERPTYEGREIVVGPRAGDFYLVESGLTEGERVVTQGAFKIDSALQILAKPSMMSGDRPVSPFEGWELSAEAFEALLNDYLALRGALAADDFDTAHRFAVAISRQDNLNSHEPAKRITEQAANSADLASLRAAFAPLSRGMLDLARRPALARPELHIAHCPMAFDNTGADWLQLGKEIENPYFGARMLKCGTIQPVTPAPPAGHPH